MPYVLETDLGFAMQEIENVLYDFILLHRTLYNSQIKATFYEIVLTFFVISVYSWR